MNKFRIYDKALAVIESCTNEFQVEVTGRWMRLAQDALAKTGTGFCDLARLDIETKWRLKEYAISKKRQGEHDEEDGIISEQLRQASYLSQYKAMCGGWLGQDLQRQALARQFAMYGQQTTR